MKKILLTILLCTPGLIAQAQLVHYGFKLGGGLSIQKFNDNSVLSTSAIRTFDAEVFGEFNIKHILYVQAGLGLFNKGGVSFQDAFTTTNKLTYLEVPVLIVKKFSIPTLGRLAIGAGEYFANGISGSVVYETPSSVTSDKVSFGAQNDFIKFDTGITASASLELNNKLTFNLGYDYGLTNIAAQTPKDTGTNGIYNRLFTVSLGLLF